MCIETKDKSSSLNQSKQLNDNRMNDQQATNQNVPSTIQVSTSNRIDSHDEQPQSLCSSSQPRGSSGSLVAVDPMQLIKKVDQEVSELESLGETFDAENQEEQYEYLDEMLTRCMIKLDDIEAGGREDVRGSRKTVLSRIEKCLAKLDTRKDKKEEER